MNRIRTLRPRRIIATEYIWRQRIGGNDVTIRPIRPEDEPLMVDFHKTLSEQTIHFRYFGTLTLAQRTMHERLRRVCFVDHDREIALVVERESAKGKREILAVGRLMKEQGCDEAEFALLISDAFQGKGLGTTLLRLLVEIGRKEGVRRIIGYIAADNFAMQNVSRKAGFRIIADPVQNECLAELLL